MSDVTMTDEPLCNETEAAALCNISLAVLRRWRYRGEGPAFIKISERRVAYAPSDLRAYIAARRHAPISEGGAR